MSNKTTDIVFLYHGPYEVFGITKHRTDRLEGIVALLENEGISVVLVPCPIKNTVEIRIHNEVIFRTDITRLHFGGDGQLDPTARAATSAVKEHFNIYVGH